MPAVPSAVGLSSGAVAPKMATGRITSLDGLRGVAALAVLFSHLITLFPAISDPISGSYEVPERGSLAWILIHTPLHFFFEGTGAVMVFFVLSGFVLALPVLRSPKFSWRAYYPQRLVRLYVPVIASVAFAVGLMLLVPRGEFFDREVDVDRPTTVTAVGVLKDVTLLFGTGYLNPPLWSLRWEIIFSLLLPLFMWVALKFWNRPLLLVAASVLGVFVGEVVHKGVLIVLPMFMIGVAFACGWDRITRIAAWMERRKRPGLAWAGLLVVGLVILEGYWYVVLLDLPSQLERGGGSVLTLIGAAVIVFVAAHSPAAKRFLSLRTVQWLGRVSFSLYLVHEPIVLAFAYAMPVSMTPLAICLSLPLSLALAEVFYRLVERPSYTLAHKVKAACAPKISVDA